MPTEEDDEEDEGMAFVSEFLKTHEKQIGDILSVWARNMEREPARRLRLIFGILGLVALTVSAIAYLTSIGKVSSDAFTFLIGSMVGYLFSYLKSMKSFGVS